MQQSCCSRAGQNLRDELWSYCALAGILFFNTAIVLLVYAYKQATSFPLVAQVFGIVLLVLGALSTVASWYVHRQQRQKKPACFCPPCCCRCCRPRGNAVAAAATSSLLPSSAALSVCKTKFFSRGNGRMFSGGREAQLPAEGGGGGTGQTGPGRPFSTPEFRRYAEFVSTQKAGVERDSRRSNMDSPAPRSYRSIYPELPGQDKLNMSVQAFVNTR
ncbi:hypothetical protein PoB_000636400 [Plakobranchus ocellatus]|uniref:Uncharacterized protein n=1 Tax=Plakobranchus ocellatus TaxID=259542 RepID=A0AAV3YA64_9GAST|nr:hypothetical protein PoB_000636400 [Plakobranchus ocellatus]